ncbi:MAG: hypothetical protein Q9186_000853 [Xanthomendoza sp. 1 TL-2023]
MLIKEHQIIPFEESGPRKDVFDSIDRWLVSPPRLLDQVDPLIAGKVRLHSSSIPHLQGESTYTINVSQKIQWQQQTHVQTSTKDFRVKESPLTLDDSAIHSLYPPPGHSDYSNVLPHVVFNNSSLPWSISPSRSEPDAPWLGLLTFTEDELTSSDTFLNSRATGLTNTPTFAKALPISQLNDLLRNSDVTSSVAFSDDNIDNQTVVQAAFVSADFLKRMFVQPHSGGNITLDRFKPMCHVRSVETSGMTNRASNGQEQFSTVIGVRTGPLANETPVVVYAHLISLSGLLDSVNHDGRYQNPVALISLYSWSYTCLPSAGGSLYALLGNIGSNVQPLRAPDSLLQQKSSDTAHANDWVKNRMLGGYSLLDYRTSNGDATLAVHRGPLTPLKPADVEFPPSDYGSDLAFADAFTGVLDLSFQLAWELGRLLMANDRSTSAALMRLRKDCHCDALNRAKTTAAQTAQSHAHPNEIIYVAQDDAVNALPSSLKSLTSFKPISGTAFFARWGKPSTFQGARTTFSLQANTVQQTYASNLLNAQAQFSRALPSKKKALRDSAPMSDCFNELNCPMSSDYAQLLSWCMNAWYLQGIPMHYILPDPVFVPKETLRTFFVDQNWFKTFFDGAFSITEHFTEQDEVRESIKANLDDYLQSPLMKDIPKPLVPRWGFILRSEMVTKFPDLRISAPRTMEFDEETEHDGRPEVIRKETIDADTILCLFDREPTRDQFPGGITLHGPEHQLCNMLGEAGDLTDSQLTFRWKPVTTVDIARNTQSRIPPTVEARVFKPTDDPETDVFDFGLRALRPRALVDNAITESTLDRTGWTVRADSWESQSLPSQHPPSNVLDGNIHSLWHTQWIGALARLPHWIEIDMKQTNTIVGLVYTPRQPQDSFNGTIGQYEIHVSNDQTYNNPPIAQGAFVQTRDATSVRFPPSTCRYVRLKALSEVQNATNQFSSCAELNLVGATTFPGVQSTASFLGSQLVSTVPKVKLTCPANLQATPISTNKFSTSKPRPNAQPAEDASPPSISVPGMTVAAPYVAPILPSASTTPHLAALGRVELYLELRKDNDLWYQSFYNYLKSPVWRGGPSNQLHDGQDGKPQAILNVFNMRATARESMVHRERGLFSVLPLSYGFRTDIHVSIGFVDADWARELNPGIGTKLVSMSVRFPVGERVIMDSPSLSSLIQPFPLDHIPQARAVGKGRRWTASTSMNGPEILVVTLRPNTGISATNDAWENGNYWDVTRYGDLSFVLANVQLNGPKDEWYGQPLLTQVTTTEQYVLDGVNRQTAVEGSITVELCPLNLRQFA